MEYNTALLELQNSLLILTVPWLTLSSSAVFSILAAKVSTVKDKILALKSTFHLFTSIRVPLQMHLVSLPMLHSLQCPVLPLFQLAAREPKRNLNLYS